MPQQGGWPEPAQDSPPPRQRRATRARREIPPELAAQEEALSNGRQHEGDAHPPRGLSPLDTVQEMALSGQAAAQQRQHPAAESGSGRGHPRVETRISRTPDFYGREPLAGSSEEARGRRPAAAPPQDVPAQPRSSRAAGLSRQAGPPPGGPPAQGGYNGPEAAPGYQELHQASPKVSAGGWGQVPQLQTRIVKLGSLPRPGAPPESHAIAPPAAMPPSPVAPAAAARPPADRLPDRFHAAVAAEPLPHQGPLGKIVVFFSGHGGCGTSMIATNSSVILAAHSLPTCLIDLDLQLGDVLTLLGIKSRYSLSNIIGDMERQEWDMISPMLDRHPSGLSVMSQVGNIETLADVEPGRVAPLLRFLQRHFRYVLVDGPRDFNDHALAAMDVADLIVLVSTQDVAALRGAGMRMEILRRLEFNIGKMKLVLNRYETKNPIKVEHIVRSLGLRPSVTLPNDFRTVSRSMNEGNPLIAASPKAKITVALRELVRDLYGAPLPEEPPGGWQRLFGRKNKK